MAGECDLCLIVVESVIPSDIREEIQKSIPLGSHLDLGGELRFFLGERTVWRDMAPPDMHWGQKRPIKHGQPKWSLNMWETQVDERLRNLMSVDKNHNLGQLEALAGSLWSGLLPRDLQERLKAVADEAGADHAPVLRIHTHLDWIPWEIMRMGNEYLGVRFQIARLPLLPVAHPVESEARKVASIYSLLGRDALRYQPEGEDDLTEALLADWQTTFSYPGEYTVPASVCNSFPSAENPDQYPALRTLENALKEGADIVHITCTGKTRPITYEGESPQPYWTLDETHEHPEQYEVDTDLVEREEMAHPIGEHRPLVFANACGSAEASRLLGDFGPCFLQLGAVAFVGAFANISKPTAVKFAREFYRRLLVPEGAEGPGGEKGKKLSIGEALWQTKKYFKEELKERDPSYLFYRLYGAPETRFELNTDE